MFVGLIRTILIFWKKTTTTTTNVACLLLYPKVAKEKNRCYLKVAAVTWMLLELKAGVGSGGHEEAILVEALQNPAKKVHRDLINHSKQAKQNKTKKKKIHIREEISIRVSPSPVLLLSNVSFEPCPAFQILGHVSGGERCSEVLAWACVLMREQKVHGRRCSFM